MPNCGGLRGKRRPRMQTPNTVRIGLNPIATTVIHRTQVGRLSMASRALLGECGSPTQINRSEGASSHEIFIRDFRVASAPSRASVKGCVIGFLERCASAPEWDPF